MGKNIQSYATTLQSISPGKGREASWQKVQILRLKNGMLNHTHSFPHFKSTSKIFQIYACLLAIIPANQVKFAPFALKSHE